MTLEWVEDEVEDYQDDQEDDDEFDDDVIQHLTPEQLDDMVQNLNNSESEDLSYKPLVSPLTTTKHGSSHFPRARIPFPI